MNSEIKRGVAYSMFFFLNFLREIFRVTSHLNNLYLMRSFDISFHQNFDSRFLLLPSRTISQTEACPSKMKFSMMLLVCSDC